jgi:hypothetical protein
MTEPTAVPVQRFPAQTLHHVWAPKLGRTVVFNHRAQLHLWVMLEANPDVSKYCERPTWPADCGPRPKVDFWVVRNGQPFWLMLGPEEMEMPTLDQANPPTDARTELAAPKVMTISTGDLDRHRVWIQNWLSLLPYLSTASDLNLGSLSASVLEFSQRGKLR